MARLEHNLTFVRTAEHLQRTHERWQLVQSACNILCSERFPSFRTEDGKLDFHKAYDALRQSSEKINDELPLRKDFGPEAVEAQIAQDVKYLFDQVRPNSSSDDLPLATLRAVGLLR